MIDCCMLDTDSLSLSLSFFLFRPTDRYRKKEYQFFIIKKIDIEKNPLISMLQSKNVPSLLILCYVRVYIMIYKFIFLRFLGTRFFSVRVEDEDFHIMALPWRWLTHHIVPFFHSIYSYISNTIFYGIVPFCVCLIVVFVFTIKLSLFSSDNMIVPPHSSSSNGDLCNFLKVHKYNIHISNRAFFHSHATLYFYFCIPSSLFLSTFRSLYPSPSLSMPPQLLHVVAYT